MSRNGSGVYSLPAGNPVVTGTTISSSWANTTLSDIATALTGSVAADGQTAMTGNLQMGNNKITGLANGSSSTDAAAYGQLTGGTVPASFTTLTLSSTLTLNGGTANQVLYLNGSKAVSGDADFTFNGTTVTMTNDASISGLTVGKGGGSGGNTSPLRTNLRGGGGGGGAGIRYDGAFPLSGTYSVFVGAGGGSGVFVSSGSVDNYMGKPGGNTFLQQGGSITYGAFGGGFKFGDLVRYTYDVGRNSGSSIPFINYFQSPASVPPYGSGGSSLVGSGFTNGNGNNGATFSIRGSVERFGAAGGGGVYAENQAKSGGLGGLGGGGNGGGTKNTTDYIIPPVKGADYTGSGGGGGSLYYQTFSNLTFFSFGATGGSGIAIIRFRQI
jgi:hypothetical protein